MENVNILMTRIDERLLHGQGQLWLRFLGANTVIVVNDEVEKDPIQQSLMKMVVSKEVAVRFFSIQKMIEVISKASPKQKIFVIVKNCEDALRLVEASVPIKEINIGNVHKAEGKEMISNTIYLNEEEKECLRIMSQKYKIEFDTTTTPSGDSGTLRVDIKKYL